MTYLNRWTDTDPFREALSMEQEMRRLLDDFVQSGAGFPAVNVWSNADQAVVVAEVPGVAPEQVSVTVEGDWMTLRGERPAPVAGDGEFHRRERPGGAFARSVRLPFEVEADQVTASARHGVLTVSLPRREATKPRKIKVQMESGGAS